MLQGNQGCLRIRPMRTLRQNKKSMRTKKTKKVVMPFFPRTSLHAQNLLKGGVVRSSRATHTTTPVPAVIFRGHLHFEPAFLPESASRSCAYLADSRYHSRLHSSNPNNPLTNKHNHTNQEHRRASAMKPRIRLLFRRVV